MMESGSPLVFYIREMEQDIAMVVQMLVTATKGSV